MKKKRRDREKNDERKAPSGGDALFAPRMVFLAVLAVIFLVAAVFVVVLTLLFTFDPLMEISGDNCRYILRAKSLVSGMGYRDLARAGAPRDASVSPGLPIILTPAVWLFGTKIIPLKIMVLLCALGYVMVLYLLLRRHMTLPWAVVIVLTAVTTTWVTNMSYQVMTEMPFLLCLTSALLLHELYFERVGSLKPVFRAGGGRRGIYVLGPQRWRGTAPYARLPPAPS